MHIEIHCLNTVIHQMDDCAFTELVGILGVDINQYQSNKLDKFETLTYSFKDTQSIYIRINKNNSDGLNDYWYVMLNLSGSFFDNSPNFRLRKLLKFFKRFRHTFKQLDVAFNDDKKCLTLKEVRHWCRHSRDYCVGSLVARGVPQILTGGGKFTRIQLWKAGSKTNYGTIYRRPDTGFFRVEIKFKDKDKIEHLLDGYSGKQLELFHAKCLDALVGCINFITARSKKNRNASKYKKQPAWQAFLGSDVKKTKWADIHRQKRENLQQSNAETSEKKIKRQGTMITNLLKKLKPILPEEDILQRLGEQSGYNLVKIDPLSNISA